MIKIAICEDDKHQAGILEDMILKTKNELNMDIFTEVFTSYEDFVNSVNKREEHNVFFMDIDLGDKSGLELAKMIRDKDSEAVIVFTTSHTEYMTDAFDIHAYHYLVKPMQQERVSKLLEDIDNVINNSNYRFTFSYNRENFSISMRKIVAFYSEKRLINLIEGNKEYQFYGKIDEVFSELPHTDFVKIRSGCIVNMNYITRIEKTRVWCSAGDAVIPLDISRNYYDQFMNEYKLYIKRQR